MSLPDEKSRAIIKARAFLRSLLRAYETPRVPKHIREEAYWCLRHFPADYELAKPSKHLDLSIFQEEAAKRLREKL